VGTLIAHALFKSATNDGARQSLARALIAAYSDPTLGTFGFNQLANQYLNSQSNFTLGRAALAIVQHVPEAGELRAKVCNNFANILQIPVSQLVGTGACSAGTTNAGACPPLNTTP
jgi:hypothetical protein